MHTPSDAFHRIADILAADPEAQKSQEKTRVKLQALCEEWQYSACLPDLDAALAWVDRAISKSLEGMPSKVGGGVPSGQQWDTGDGWTCQKVVRELEELRESGMKFTSRRKLARHIGCKLGLVQKALSTGPVELKAWATKQRGPSRRNMAPEASEVILSNMQGRELDPGSVLYDSDVDVVMAKLLDIAGPEEKARINAMTPAEQRQLAEAYYSQEKDAKEHAKPRRSVRNKP